MKDQLPFRQKPAFVAAFALTTAVVFTLGVLHMFTGYVPGRPTRLGYAEPMFGIPAQQFGLSVAIASLLPLCLLARTWKQAALGYAVLLTALAANLAFGRALWS